MTSVTIKNQNFQYKNVLQITKTSFTIKKKIFNLILMKGLIMFYRFSNSLSFLEQDEDEEGNDYISVMMSERSCGDERILEQKKMIIINNKWYFKFT